MYKYYFVAVFVFSNHFDNFTTNNIIIISLLHGIIEREIKKVIYGFDWLDFIITHLKRSDIIKYQNHLFSFSITQYYCNLLPHTQLNINNAIELQIKNCFIISTMQSIHFITMKLSSQSQQSQWISFMMCGNYNCELGDPTSSISMSFLHFFATLLYNPIHSIQHNFCLIHHLSISIQAISFLWQSETDSN